MDENNEPDFFDIVVARGVGWLDENAPAQWWDRIDYDTLDVSDGHTCVLGQVFAAEADTAGIAAGYIYALREFDDIAEIAMGFCGGDSDYYFLREAWIDAIENRRAEVSA